MASRRCFLTAIAVLALAILLVAMTAAGGPAVIHDYTKTFRGDQLAVLNRTWSTIARRPDGTTALAPSLSEDLQDAFGEQTLLHFTLSQLRGQKSNKTALSKDQQVELLLSARRVIQKIVPAPARPASGSVKDTCIDADTLMLQVRLRLSACMREHDLSLKHHSILDCLVCVSASGH